MSRQSILTTHTGGRDQVEITERIHTLVAESGVQQGLAHLFTRHTSCSLMITENADPDVRRDLETIFARQAPDGDPAYAHRLEGPDDMAAHARSILAGVELTIPIGGGRLLLGTWQGVFVWEHRHRGHTREIVVTIVPAA